MCISLQPQFTHLIMATSNMILHHVTKSSETGSMNMTVSSVYVRGLPSHQITSSESNRAPLGCERMVHSFNRDSQHEHSAVKSATIMWCNHISKDQNFKGIFPCGIHATRNWSCSENKRRNTHYYHGVPNKLNVYVSMSLLMMLTMFWPWHYYPPGLPVCCLRKFAQQQAQRQSLYLCH